MMKSLSVSVCRNSPGMSNIVTALSSYASMRDVRNTNSVHAVGDVAYSFLMYIQCLLPFEHALPFMSPFLFYFKNVNETITFCLVSLVILLGSWGMKVCILCSFESSFLTAFYPLSPSSFVPLLMLYCVIMIPKMKLSLSFSDISLYPWVWMNIGLC